MKIKLTISDLDLTTTDWILLYEPEKSVPFTTIQGTEHVWNWNFVNGNLMKDGVPLLGSEGYSIVIENTEDVNDIV